MDIISYAKSKSYTEDSISGVGFLAGSPCQISSIEDIEGGHRVTFLWVDNSGEEHTDTMDVMNGEKGEKGDKGDKGDQGTPGSSGTIGEYDPEDEEIILT